MRGIKNGLSFTPKGEGGWMNSHAQVPTVLVRPGYLRIYFASRPDQQASYTTFLDVSSEDPGRILRLHQKPILQWGPPGAYDEHAVMPQCAIDWQGRTHLYYAGWSRRASIPYSNWTGLAVSDDAGESFRKYGDVPVLDRAPGEILSATGLFCIEENGILHGWYSTGIAWKEYAGKLESTYQIRHAVSRDGIHWERDNTPVIPTKSPDEANTRPAVIRIGDRWHMWFCFRSYKDYRDGQGSYRIGYAWSRDLRTWVRDDDQAGIGVSETGWDSTMLAYPYVVEAGGRILLFYNGNGFGKTGIGYAVLDA